MYYYSGFEGDKHKHEGEKLESYFEKSIKEVAHVRKLNSDIKLVKHTVNNFELLFL